MQILVFVHLQIEWKVFLTTKTETKTCSQNFWPLKANVQYTILGLRYPCEYNRQKTTLRKHPPKTQCKE